MTQDELKALVGQAALAYVEAGSIVGVGTGSTVNCFIDALAMTSCPPELLHHLALFHAKAATVLEHTVPESAATAWVRSLAAWLALAEER